MPFTLQLFLAFLCNIGHAVTGVSLTEKKFDPVCKVTIRTQDSLKLIGMCTGVLTSKNRVQTAAHCIIEDAKYFVECGYQSFNDQVAVTEQAILGFPNIYTLGATFKETHEVVSAKKEITSFDKAKLKLKTRAKLKPAKKGDLNILSDLLENDRCYFAGYGKNNESKGLLNAVKISGAKISIQEKVKTFQLNIKTNPMDFSTVSPFRLYTAEAKGLIDSGDSGSSIICEYKNELYAFGVASSIGYESNNPYTGVLELIYSL